MWGRCINWALDSFHGEEQAGEKPPGENPPGLGWGHTAAPVGRVMLAASLASPALSTASLTSMPHSWGKRQGSGKETKSVLIQKQAVLREAAAPQALKSALLCGNCSVAIFGQAEAIYR